MRRRGFLGALGAALFAPAVIRTPGLLMPVRPLLVTPSIYAELSAITRKAMLPRLHAGIFKPNALVNLWLAA